LNRRKSLRNRRGDLGGPIVTLLLAVAGIAIAGGVIAYMMGYMGNLQKPNIEADSVTLTKETRDGQTHWILSFSVDTTNSRALKITSITIVDDNGAKTIDLSKNPIVVESGKSEVKKIDLTALNSDLTFGDKASYKVVLYTNAGVYRLTATLV